MTQEGEHWFIIATGAPPEVIDKICYGDYLKKREVNYDQSLKEHKQESDGLGGWKQTGALLGTARVVGGISLIFEWFLFLKYFNL